MFRPGRGDCMQWEQWPIALWVTWLGLALVWGVYRPHPHQPLTRSCHTHGGDVSSVPVRDSPPPPFRALRAHLVTKGQWLLAIHRVAPKAPENFGDPRECRGCAKGAHLGQSLNARFVAWCIMVTPGIGFDFRFCSLCWGPP